MKSPAYLVAKYLESLGDGTIGTDLFVGKEPEVAGTIATIYDTGGSDPLHNLCADPDANTWRPSIQLRVRSDSYPTAFARIGLLRRSILMLTGYSITEVAAGVQTTDSILDAIARSDIISIGEDANNRPVLTANFDLLFSSHQFTVDKSALQSALAAAGALTEADYTPASWAVLADAVTSGQGIYDDPSATQEQVDDATQVITDAIAALVPVPVGCTSCLGAWTNAPYQSAPFAPMPLTGAPCFHTAEVTDPEAGKITVATTDPATPFTINWPADEVRVFGMDIVSRLLNGSQPASIFMLVTATDQSTTLTLESYNDDGEKAEIISSHGESGTINLTVAPTRLYIGIGGDGACYAIAGGQYLKLPATANLPLAKSYMVGMLVDSTGATFTGAGKSTAVTDAENMPSSDFPSIFDVLTIANLCGTVIETRSPQPNNEFPLNSDQFMPYGLVVSGADSQTVTLPTVYDANQSHFAVCLHDTISVSGIPAGELRGVQAKVLDWATEANTNTSIIVHLGVAGSAVSKYGVDAVYDSTTGQTVVRSQYSVDTVLTLTGEVKDFFIGIVGGTKQVVIIAGGQYGIVQEAGSDLVYEYSDINTLLCQVTPPSGLGTLPSQRIVSKAAEMDIAVPDMSTEGITSVADFAGNVLS